MNYICPFSSLRFSLAPSPAISTSTVYISLHPAITMHPAQLASLQVPLLKFFGMLHILHKRGLVSYKECKAFKPFPQEAAGMLAHANNMLHNICFTQIPSSKSLKAAPKFHAHNASLTEVVSYLDSLTDYLLDANKLTVDAAEEFVQETLSQRRARVAQKMQSSRIIEKCASWADEQLLRRMPGYGIHRSEHLKAALRGERPIAIIRNVKEMLLDFLPESSTNDAFQKEALIRALDEQLASILHTLAQRGMLDAEEREIAESLSARYTTDTMRADTHKAKELASTLSAAQDFSMQEPKREDYPNALAFNIAKAAYAQYLKETQG